MKVPDYGIPTQQGQQGQMPTRAQMLMAIAIMNKLRPSTNVEDDRTPSGVSNGEDVEGKRVKPSGGRL